MIPALLQCFLFPLALVFFSFLSLPAVHVCWANSFPCCSEALSGLRLHTHSSWISTWHTCTQSSSHSPAVFRTGSSIPSLLQHYGTLSSSNVRLAQVSCSVFGSSCLATTPPVLYVPASLAFETWPLWTSTPARLTPGSLLSLETTSHSLQLVPPQTLHLSLRSAFSH